MNKEEIWREGSKVVVDYDTHLIHITSVGDFDIPKALRCREFIYGIFEASHYPFDLIIDITYEGSHAPGTRAVWKEINRHEKVRYVALCGVNSVAKVIHTFIIGFKKHPKLRLFTNKRDALTWLGNFVKEMGMWFDSRKDALPANQQVVLFSVEGVQYIGRYESARKRFKVEDELRETIFSVDRQHIYWKYFETTGKGQVELFI